MQRIFLLRICNLMIFSLFLLSNVLLAATVKMSWNQNAETDLAGYKIYYGQQSRNYNNSLDAGLTTNFVVSGLDERVEYYFTLTAYDTAGNESDYSKELNCILGDTNPVKVVQVIPVSLTEIRVVFNKIVNEGSVSNIDNYSISSGITIQKAIRQQDRKTVRLLTSEHAVGDSYSLIVNNILDINVPANKIADGTTVNYVLSEQQWDETPPTITLVALNSSNELDVYFSEAIDAATALENSNYSIDNGIGINSASLVENNIVRLVTTDHSTGINYTITVNNVSDISDNKNPIKANSTYSYSYNPGDVIGPVITLANIVEPNRVDVMFNERLDEASATTSSNYSINNGITVQSVSLDGTGQVVSLSTTNHTPEQSYTVTVNNVSDASPNKNTVAPNSQYTYLYHQPDAVPPTIKRIDVVDYAQLRVIFSELVDPVSAQNAANYKIAGITVYTARLDAKGDAVLLETNRHQPGQSYMITITGVKDASTEQNEIAANSTYTYSIDAAEEGPTIVEAHVNDPETVVITFSKTVEKTSAENPANYQISGGITTSTAKLNDTKTVVELKTSAMQPDKVYTLTINNVTDETDAKTPIEENSNYSFSFEGTDTTPPLITLVKTIDAENIDVLFTEAISREQAETISNYEINGNIRVISATLDGSQHIVHLNTTTHSPNKVYIVRVKNIVDKSEQANEIAPNSSYSYLYEPSDAVAPTIAMVRTLSSEQLEVIFSEPIESTTATNPKNFLLNNDITVKTVEMGSSNHSVLLNVYPLDPGKVYVLLVNGIFDLYGNRIATNSSYTFSYGEYNFEEGPRVTGVTALAKDKLRVVFSTKIDQASAEEATNYIIQSGISIHSATVDTSGKAVVLQTSEHEAGKIYVLLVKHIGRFDAPDVVANSNVPFFYLFNETENSIASITDISILGETLVEVNFSKAVDRLSAENRYNYQISPGVVILDAELDPNGTKVLLETSRHLAGVVYTISVNGVKTSDLPASTSFVKGSYAYAYLPSLQVTLDGYAETSVSFIDVGKEYYLDRNYVITDVPKELKHTKMIMTTNNEKTNSDTRFMEINLSKAAVIYVAYDSRAASVPNWLNSKFTKTEMSLGVSEKADQLDLWQGYFPSGELILGGNLALGARDAKSMYIVLVQEPTFGTSPGGGSLEDALQNGGALPDKMVLFQNYPNPFNPTTTIGFEIPIEKQVRLIVYDILGRRVNEIYNSPASAGYHQVVWDATDQWGTQVAAGVYFYRLEVWENGERGGLQFKENYVTETGKMILLK